MIRSDADSFMIMSATANEKPSHCMVTAVTAPADRFLSPPGDLEDMMLPGARDLLIGPPPPGFGVSDFLIATLR